MTLVRKTALIVALFTAANIGFGYAIKRNLIDPAFEGFEHKSAEKSMMQVSEALARESAHLDAIAYDNASWDLTYDYVVSPDREYYDDNLSPEVLADSNINWAIVVDASGRVVSGPIRDIKTQQLVTTPEIPQGQWELSHPLLSGDSREKPIAGLMVTRDGPTIVAARDILTSLGAGPSRGRLVMARALDAAFVREIGARVGLDLNLWLAIDPEVPAEISASLRRGDGDNLVVIADSETNQLDAYRMFSDVVGNPAIILGAKLPREMTQSAANIGGLCVLWMILQGGILVFIIMVPLHRAIIAPLSVLSAQLRIFRRTSDLNLSLDTEQEGEIGEISREFGNMLRQLEDEIEERRKGEEDLRRAATVFNIATESIVIANADGIVVDVNTAFSETTGFRPSEVIGQGADVLTADRHVTGFFGSIMDEVIRVGKWEGEIWIRHKEGKPIPAWASVGCTIGDQEKVERVVVLFNDMTERKNAEAVIAQQANYDMLTKLPNRYLFRDRLRKELLRAKRDDTSVALLFIDIDGFKKINDTLGHAAGDKALCDAAERIKRAIRGTDSSARLGGDEFAVILPEAENTHEVENVAQRILSAIAVPLAVYGQEVVLTASIGVALYPGNSEDDEDLLRNADVAMYRSKESGGDTFEFFSQEMSESAARKLLVESYLRKGLELNEFEVHYQPIVALREGRMVGVEALLRWETPELGVVSPDEFIPIAERSGMIVPIGAWVLETACRQVKEWHDAEWPGLRVAVNISPREVDRGEVLNSIQNALVRSSLPAEFLEIEVTERVFLDDVESVAAVFKGIKDLGVRLCIDDFGTGYSSLSYLQNYPFDVLKIDRAFVSRAVDQEDGVALLRAINSMANSLHLDVVAEGVETRKQRDLLIELGCGFAQGYYFCRPMSAERLEMGDVIADLLGESPTPG